MSDSRFSSELSRRRLLTWALGAGGAMAGAMALNGCDSSSTRSGAQGNVITLSFWNGFTGGDGTYIRKLVDDFNKATPHIQVRMNAYMWIDLFQKLAGAVISGQAPDVAVMHVDDIPTNAARSLITPIDEVARALGLEASAYTSRVVWEGGVYRGKRYGIPLDMHPLGMFYNKAVLRKAGLNPDKPPRTGDEYMAVLEELKGKGIQGHWVTPFLFTGRFQFETLLWQFGGELFDPEGTRATFDSEAGVRALTWMVDLVKKGYSPANVSQDADYIALQNGRNAFNWNGIWQINGLKDVPGLEWGAAPVPRIGTQDAVWGNSHQFVLPKQRAVDPARQEAARTFIQWMSQRSLEWLKSAKIPVLKSVAESAEFKSMEAESQFALQSEYIRFPPAVAGIADAMLMVEKAVSQGVLGRASPEEALKAAAAQATQVVQHNRKKYGA